MYIYVDRIAQNEFQTEGLLRLINESGEVKFKCRTLELPWRENKRTVSCIPAGRYQAMRHQSPRFGNCILLFGVKGRSEILIHYGNFFHDTLGCILVGRDFLDMDGDGHLDVTFSRATINRLYDLCTPSLEVIIRDRFKKKPGLKKKTAKRAAKVELA
ncbi:MAG: DUF5675 family protein [Balneolia bacterium]|nr:DUF5675 family protein [Balneolia bacterium]